MKKQTRGGLVARIVPARNFQSDPPAHRPRGRLDRKFDLLGPAGFEKEPTRPQGETKHNPKGPSFYLRQPLSKPFEKIRKIEGPKQSYNFLADPGGFGQGPNFELFHLRHVGGNINRTPPYGFLGIPMVFL